MKKILIIMAVLVVALVYKKENQIIIPVDSIRLRVIANSNSNEDQLVKNQISKELSNYLEDVFMNIHDFQLAKKTLSNEENNIKSIINKYTSDYEINIGSNYFPQKQYKGVLYEAGNYNSIVVKLGKNNGLNWWCVVYPPLCLINDQQSDVEYTSIIKEVIENHHDK